MSTLIAFFLMFVVFLMLTYLLIDFLALLFGAPFVPTSNKVILEILNKADLKPGQVFLELGSGDGRVVRLAVKNFQVKGRGVEFHPMLVWYSKLRTKFLRLKDIIFIRQNFFQTDFSQAEVIFLFLLPKTVRKLRQKFLKECKKGTVIISHGFPIPEFEKYQIDMIERPRFSTYYYRI